MKMLERRKGLMDGPSALLLSLEKRDPMARIYSLQEKIEALDQIGNERLIDVSLRLNISVTNLSRWRREADVLRRQFVEEQKQRAAACITQAQIALAEASVRLVQALDEERIAKAPINQIATALGVVVDRYLKLTGETPPAEQVIRFEYITANGDIAHAPPWADAHSQVHSAIPRRGMWAAVRQDGTGEDGSDRQSLRAWGDDMVAGSHLPHGESGVAGFEDNDSESLWDED
jgi:hypothetical protein